jgi:hypothetical protein
MGDRFQGQFNLSKTLTLAQYNELDQFAGTRHEEPGMPSIWCDWIPVNDGTGLKWDGTGTFYCPVEWLQYLIEHFLMPWGNTLNGDVFYQSEEFGDFGIIRVQNNVVTRIKGRTETPKTGEDFSGYHRRYVHMKGELGGKTSNLVGRVMFGYRDNKSGGVPGEISMNWQVLDHEIVPFLKCWNDGWSSLASFPEVIAWLGERNDENITPQQFCQFLQSCGFVDETD